MFSESPGTPGVDSEKKHASKQANKQQAIIIIIIVIISNTRQVNDSTAEAIDCFEDMILQIRREAF